MGVSAVHKHRLQESELETIDDGSCNYARKSRSGRPLKNTNIDMNLAKIGKVR